MVGGRLRTALWTVGLILVTSSWPLGHAASQDASRTGLSVVIDEPRAGIVQGDLTVQLHAHVSDPEARLALLSVNGAAYEVPVERGRIRQQVVVVPGNNRVGVVVSHRGRTARDSVTFHLDSQGQRADLLLIVGWQARGEIIDLWVREPNGETCKWDHRETAAGGRLLDFSEDAIGFGSQAYVLPSVRAGRYRVKVHYWGAYGRDDDRSSSSYDELIRRLDRTTERLSRATASAGAERNELATAARRLQAQLDRWSEPAAIQTPVHAEIVLFPGTRHERRWRFDVVAQRVGQLTTLGEIEVTEAMVRAARAEDRR